jgi:hypothetical protein
MQAGSRPASMSMPSLPSNAALTKPQIRGEQETLGDISAHSSPASRTASPELQMRIGQLAAKDQKALADGQCTTVVRELQAKLDRSAAINTLNKAVLKRSVPSMACTTLTANDQA